MCDHQWEHQCPKDVNEGTSFFYEPYVAGARGTEKTLNPDVTEVKVIVNGIPNKIWIAADISRI